MTKAMKLEAKAMELLFPSPLFKMHIEGHETLNAQISQMLYKMKEEDEGVSRSNRNGWHSEPNLLRNAAPCFQTLKNALGEAVIGVTRQVAPKFDTKKAGFALSAWGNINPREGFNTPHTHPGNQWSGTYYVKQPKVETGDSGKIEFLDPRTDLAEMRIMKSPMFRNKTRMRPAEGDLIIFPSYLMHWVHPNDTDEDRISIAFNAVFNS